MSAIAPNVRFLKKLAPSLKSLKALTVAAAMTLLAGCNGNEEKEEEVVTLIPVEVSTAFKGDVSSYYTSTATLEAESEANVVAKVSGVVTQYFVEEGDFVNKGQALAQLDTERLKLRMEQSKARLKQLEAELKRNETIYKKKLVSSGNYEKIKFEYEALKASFELDQLELDYATIKAPIAGLVTQRMVKVGNMIKQNDMVYQIADFDPLLAIVYVPEGELTKLKVDQAAMVKVGAYPDTLFDGRVDRISPIIDPLSGTFKVTVQIDSNNNGLKPGMFGRIAIHQDQHKDTLLIDKNALISQDGEMSIFVVEEGKAIKRTVTIGYGNNDHIEVLSGLNLGDQAVTTGKSTLKPDSAVEVINQEQAITAQSPQLTDQNSPL